MTASRELDALIAEKVMGAREVLLDPTDGCVAGARQFPATNGRNASGRVPFYSSDIAAAWTVVEKMRERKMAFVLGANGHSEQFSAWFFNGIWALAKNQNSVPDHGDPHLYGSATAGTAPLAIALAALQALGVEVPA